MSYASRHGLLDRFRSGGYTQTGARIGSAFGPIGMGLGALIGNLWGRHQTAQANAGMDAISAGVTASLNNAIWGNGWNAQPGTGIPLQSAAPDDPYAVTNTDSPLLASLGITQWGAPGSNYGANANDMPSANPDTSWQGSGINGGFGSWGGGGAAGGVGGGYGMSGSGSWSGGTGEGAAGVQSKFASKQFFDIE
jgi:hypothetical protein